MRALVHVGYACNNRCVFCAQGELRAGSEGRVADQEVRRRVETARPAADAVTFLGGEPTVREELPAWAALARSLGFRTVQVQTNGRRLAYRSYARTLRDAGVDDLDVSLHGHEAAVHDWHVSVDGAFAQTTAGIANAVASGMTVGTTTVVGRSNYRHLPDVVRLSAKLGASRVHLAAAAPRGSAEASFDSVVPRFALLAEPLAQALDAARRSGLPAIVSGVPACFLGGNAVASADVLGVVTDVARAHGLRCEPCTWRGACAGLPAEYVRRLGDGEVAARGDAIPQAPRTLGEAASRIAGPGPMEPVRPERLPERPPPADVLHARLQELGRPAPAAQEVRVGIKRKTGDALVEIFPELLGRERG